MDSLLNSELLDRILVADIMSLSSVESDDELLGCNRKDLQKHHPPARPYSIMTELQQIHTTKTNCTNHTLIPEYSPLSPTSPTHHPLGRYYYIRK